MENLTTTETINNFIKFIDSLEVTAETVIKYLDREKKADFLKGIGAIKANAERPINFHLKDIAQASKKATQTVVISVLQILGENGLINKDIYIKTKNKAIETIHNEFIEYIINFRTFQELEEE